jgi:predicted 3-demethylubiquinone-9 3-methyltransferase (glyoxalase superfamily)
MPTVTPFLWFDSNAEEAVSFYTSTFKNSRVTNVVRNAQGWPGTPGSVLTITFEIEGREFMALNGGPLFTFNQAFSIVVSCDTQNEVDELWERLSEGGEPGRCAWLRDRFGLWWQIVPRALNELLSDPDPARARRVLQAMLKMSKIEVSVLRAAADASSD